MVVFLQSHKLVHFANMEIGPSNTGLLDGRANEEWVDVQEDREGRRCFE